MENGAGDNGGNAGGVEVISGTVTSIPVSSAVTAIVDEHTIVLTVFFRTDKFSFFPIIFCFCFILINVSICCSVKEQRGR